MPDEYIDLDRRFRELSSSARESDDIDLLEVFQRGDPLSWADLKKERRVVLLAEAGAGKTAEIREAAKSWRSNGHAAFFLRLEHVADELAVAFEEGDFADFESWKASTDEGWILLDSVDEARLRGPQDFERAIRKLALSIRGCEDRLHILITGRITAWRPKTDLEFCERHLPPPAMDRRIARRDDQIGDGGAADGVAADISSKEGRPSYLIVTIADLDRERIAMFARAKGIERLDDFLGAVERRDAWSYTRRPQDLLELVEFWREHGRLGGRFELAESSVARRLIERNRTHAEWQPLTPDRVHEAARAIAAACILTRKATIRVPDGHSEALGLELEAVLPDWDARELGSLLARPLFDEAIYGTVRFHHREAREYLAAQWFARLLARETSRSRIEGLFFVEQYGVDVIVPTMRPILPWLAIFDDRIRERLLRIAPEVLFEGGDPSRLPLPTREAILRDCCRDLAAAGTPRTFTDYSAIQRFAAPDLAEAIGHLIDLHSGDEEVLSFLCRMIWIGELGDLRPQARAIASRADLSPYTRTVAVRALAALSATAELLEIRQAVLAEEAPTHRDLLAELTTATLHGSDDTGWLVAALRVAEPPRAHAVDRVVDALKERIEAGPLSLARSLAGALGEMLAEHPHVDPSYCPVSKDWSWLAPTAGKAVGRLIAERDPTVLEGWVLMLLRRVGLARQYIAGLGEAKSALAELVRAWDALRRDLFWHEASACRQPRTGKDAPSVRHFGQIWLSSRFWEVRAEDFDYFVKQISARPDPDDRAVALSVALALFKEAERPEVWRKRLVEAARGDDAFEATLRDFFDPPPETEQSMAWRRQERAWKLRSERAKAAEERRRQSWRDGLRSELDRLRNSGLTDPPGVSQSQWYLLNRMREACGERNRWTDGNWEDLVAEYGTDVAEAFRDGALGFWRHYDPLIRSEGGEANSVPAAHVFGLAGLAMEARGDDAWVAALSPDEAERATRYAVGELNGFPTWLPRLFAAHPVPVVRVLATEIEHQIRVETADVPCHYVLDDVAWVGPWSWDAVAPHVMSMLDGSEPLRADTLGKLLFIVHGSTVPDETIANLAARGLTSSASADCRAVWFASLIGVDPDSAIPLLRKHLDGINDPEDRTRFAMHVVTRLLGGRFGEGIKARTRFVEPRHLGTLHALMHEHIRQRDDIDRVGEGVYSPDLRDNAQDARNSLLRLLDDIPGKEAFLALMKLATEHPEEALRPHFRLRAKRRAEADADPAPWDANQFLDFSVALERTPQNHRELAELVLLHLLDLKADLEHGDESLARLLRRVSEETEMRNLLAGNMRYRAHSRYSLAQEHELADGKRPDLRFHGNGFDAPVPAELKLADRWTGPSLLERLEVQLCGDYLRDDRSRRGFFVLVHNGTQRKWSLGVGERVDFDGLVKALEVRWADIAPKHPGIDGIRVVGINLLRRDAATDAKANAPPRPPKSTQGGRRGRQLRGG